MAKAKKGIMADIDSQGTDTRPTVLICTNCKGQQPSAVEDEPLAGARLAEAVTARFNPAQVKVLPIRCLANCSRGPSVAIMHPGSWSYIFGNIDPVGDAEAVLEGAQLLAGSILPKI
jgi:predicted metal-binding protein